MKWPLLLRGVVMAALVGTVAGGVLGLYMRFRPLPVGLAGGRGWEPGLVTIGCPAGGGGWITIYRGTDEVSCARARVPWRAYVEEVGTARPLPLHLKDGTGEQIVVALDAMPGETGGWIVVLDKPENRCAPLAWRRVVHGETQGPETLWVAGGDIDGDGREEVVVGGPQAGGEVLVLDDLAHDLAPLATLRAPWGEYGDKCGETRPAVGDLDGDGRAEVVIGLAAWQGRGGWVAVYKDLSFAKWVRFPDEGYEDDGGGTWPAVAVDEDGRASLILAGDGPLGPRVAVISDALGAGVASWIQIPATVAEASSGLRPASADLSGTGASHVLAYLPDASAAVLFDRASSAYAFLGWRRGVASRTRDGSQDPGAPDPLVNAREAALEALRERCGELDVSRGPDGSVDGLFGTLSAPSGQPPVEQALAFLRDNAGIWGIGEPTRALSLDEERSSLAPDDCKTTHVCFQQTVCGVPLLGHRLVVHLDATGAVTGTTGVLDPFSVATELDKTPTVSKETALDAVRRAAPAPLAQEPQARLVAWRDDGPVRLCWAMEAVSVAAGSGAEYVVDARTGDVVSVQGCAMQDVTETPAPGRSRTTLGNTVTLSITRREYVQTGTGDAPPPPPRLTYEWVDRRREARVTTKIATSAAVGQTGETIGHMYFELEEGDFDHDVWLGNWPPDDPVHMEAASAHRNMGKVLHYWCESRGRAGWDGRNGGVFLTLVPENAGLADRCAWLGQGWIAIGRPASARTVPTLDVLAHEFAHGVVHSAVGGMTTGAAGAINEHIADAFGGFTEYRELGETEDQGRDGAVPPARRPGIWVHGSERGGGPMRDFTACEGHDYGNYDFDDRRRNDASGATVNDNGNMHLNAGILDHWLYVWVHGEPAHRLGGSTYAANGAPGASLSGTVTIGNSGMIQGGVYGESDAIRCAERAYLRLVIRYGAGLRTFDGFRVRMMRAIADVTSLRSPAVAKAELAFKAVHLWPPYRDERARFSGPVPGTTLTSSEATFRWAPIPAATEYRLSVGSTPGGTDIFNASLGRSLSADVPRIPTDGRALYVRLWWKVAGAWYYRDVTYTAFDSGVPVITAPAPGSTLASNQATFTWTAGEGNRRYMLLVGSSPGESDLASSGAITSHSCPVSGLPRDGTAIHVRLRYSRSDTAEDWRFVDAILTAATIGPPPAITSPSPGSTLISASAAFAWTAAPDATNYQLRIGAEAGGGGWFDRQVGAVLGANVTGLPTDGSTLYVQLLALYAGRWRLVFETTCTAATSGENPAPSIRSPTPGTVFTTSGMRFEWTAGAGVTNYYIAIGRAADGSDITSWNDRLGALSTNFPSLPTDGLPLYFWLRVRWGGIWRVTSAAYTAATDAPPRITCPTPGSTLRSSRVTFAWTPGLDVDQYELRVGSALPMFDLFHYSGRARSAVAPSLPTNGREIHVRLKYMVNNAWRESDFTYTASTTAGNVGPLAPTITSPVPGSFLSSSSPNFAWNATPGATEYYLQIGSNINQHDLYDQSAGTGTSVRVTGLPADGRNLHARLFALVDGSWFWTDARYNASGNGGHVMTPEPGSTLSSSTVTFAWGERFPVRQYRLQVGTGLGRRDIAEIDASANLSAQVSGLPTDGRPVFVRLWFEDNHGWHLSDASYTAVQSGPWVRTPAFTNPLVGRKLTRGNATFAWRRGSGETQYALRVASADGNRVFFDQALGDRTFANVTGLPTDDAELVVRLACNSGGTTRSIEARYRTADVTQATPNNSPMGDTGLRCVDEASSMISAAAGGSVQALDGASVSFPPASLSEDATITLRKWEPDGATADPFRLYTIDQGPSTLGSPATVRLPVDERARLRGPDDVRLYQENESMLHWDPIPVQLSEDRRWISAQVSHFSGFFDVSRSQDDVDIEGRELRHACVEPLSVPYYGQGNYSWCWATSFAMVEGYYGYDSRVWDVAYGNRVRPWDGGGSAEPLERFARTQTPPPVLETSKFYRARPLKAYLMRQLDAGRPVWVGVYNVGRTIIKPTCHAIVVVGYDADRGVRIHDPSGALVQGWFGDAEIQRVEVSGGYAAYLVPWADWEQMTGYSGQCCLNPFSLLGPNCTAVITSRTPAPKPVSVQLMSPTIPDAPIQRHASLVFDHQSTGSDGTRQTTCQAMFWWNGKRYPGHQIVHMVPDVRREDGFVTATGEACNNDRLKSIHLYLSNTSDAPTPIHVTVSFDRVVIQERDATWRDPTTQAYTTSFPARRANVESDFTRDRPPVGAPPALLDFGANPVAPGFHELLIEARGGGATDRALLNIEVAPAEVKRVRVQPKPGEPNTKVLVMWDSSPEERMTGTNIEYIVKRKRGLLGQPEELGRVQHGGTNRFEYAIDVADRPQYAFQVWAHDLVSNLESQKAMDAGVGNYYVWTDSVGWLRAGSEAALNFAQLESEEIWGGSSTRPLVKTVVDGAYVSLEEAQAAIGAELSQVTVEFNPLVTPREWIRATLPNGRRLNVRLGLGNDPEAMPFIGQQYDLAEEMTILKRNGIAAKMNFGRAQWLVHATGHGTMYGSVRDDFWMLIAVQPVNGRFEIPDGIGGTFTYSYDRSFGPYRDSFELIPQMRTLSIGYLDVWGEARTVWPDRVPDGTLYDHGWDR